RHRRPAPRRRPPQPPRRRRERRRPPARHLLGRRAPGGVEPVPPRRQRRRQRDHHRRQPLALRSPVRGRARGARALPAAPPAPADPGAMIEAASRFRERHDESPFAPSALYAIAVARDLAGHRDAGRAALEELAGDHGSGAGRHAAALLASADYSALDAIRDAERRHARDTARYVLVGGRLDGRNALYTASQFGAEGARAAESFGMFNVIGVLTRAWQAWRHDPVSNQAIVERGEAFLARAPLSPDAPQVHARLADAYER